MQGDYTVTVSVECAMPGWQQQVRRIVVGDHLDAETANDYAFTLASSAHALLRDLAAKAPRLRAEGSDLADVATMAEKAMEAAERLRNRVAGELMIETVDHDLLEQAFNGYEG